jgi:hypothetical protein
VVAAVWLVDFKIVASLYIAGWTTDGVADHFPTVRALLKRLPYGLRLDDSQVRGGSGPGAQPVQKNNVAHVFFFCWGHRR